MSEDRRSRRMVAAINCIMNHNARAPNVAKYPGMNTDVTAILQKHGVGVIQMPCPEMVHMGHSRPTKEDETYRDVMDTPEGQACCEELSARVINEIEDYQRNGYQVLAILGGDVKSPGCAVPVPLADDSSEWGVFIWALRKEMAKRGIDIPIRGIRDSSPETLQASLAWLEDRLETCSHQQV